MYKIRCVSMRVYAFFIGGQAAGLIGTKVGTQIHLDQFTLWVKVNPCVKCGVNEQAYRDEHRRRENGGAVCAESDKATLRRTPYSVTASVERRRRENEGTAERDRNGDRPNGGAERKRHMGENRVPRGQRRKCLDYYSFSAVSRTVGKLYKKNSVSYSLLYSGGTKRLRH